MCGYMSACGVLHAQGGTACSESEGESEDICH